MDRIAFVLAWVACCGMVSPTAVFGSQPVSGTVQDVAMAGGAFTGQVVDTQGNGLVGVPVSMANQNGLVAQVTSGADGRFSVPQIQGGVYQVSAASTSRVCRVWAESTAPPVATRGMLLVAPTSIVRGQCASGGCGDTSGGYVMNGPVNGGGYVDGGMCGSCGTACGGACGGGCGSGCGGGFGGGVLGMVSNPWFVGAVVAAAIAIPLALDDDDDAS